MYRRSAVSGDVHRAAKSRPPKRCKRPALLLSWELYMKHVVRAAAAEGHLRALLPIGKEVYASITGPRLRSAIGPGAVLHDAHPAPNAWVPGGYGPFFLSLSRACRAAGAASDSDTAPDAPPPAEAPAVKVEPA